MGENMNEYEHYHSERKLLQEPKGYIHVGSGYEVDECMEKNIPFILLQRYHINPQKKKQKTFSHNSSFAFLVVVLVICTSFFSKNLKIFILALIKSR